MHAHTLHPKGSLVELSTSDNVGKGTFHLSNEVMPPGVLHSFPVIHIIHHKPQRLNLLKAVLQQKCL